MSFELKSSCTQCIEREQRIAELEAELAKYKLKWQTGNPPTTGWYWLCQLDDSNYTSPAWLSKDKEYKKWAGPILPPEE